MIHLGQKNKLSVLRETDFGFYLGDEVGNDVLLPRKWAPTDLAIDDTIDVFIYRDHEERIIATTLEPKIMLGEFAYLKTKIVDNVGAFMDWGLEKDLLVPFKNQPKKLEEDKWYCIYLYIDEETDRLVGTARINAFLDQTIPEYKIGDAVHVLIAEDTDIGVNVIVDDQFRGLIYHSDIFKKIRRGDYIPAFVKNVREDGKLDIALEPIGVERLEVNAQKLLDYLKANGGKIYLSDKSAPDEIYNALEMSKKTFKASLGILYKAKKIILDKKFTELI